MSQLFHLAVVSPHQSLTHKMLFLLLLVAASLTERRYGLVDAKPTGADYKPCKVSDINVQRTFDVRRFAGIWYDAARVSVDAEVFQLSSPVSEYTISDDGSQLLVRYGGQMESRLDRCVRPLAVSGRLDASNGTAKLELAFDDYPLGFLRGAFWVIETNYNYALVYSCFRIRADGACESNHDMAYVISRRRLLPEPLLRRVQYIIRHRLCIDPARLRLTEHQRVCPPDPNFNMTEYLLTLKEPVGDSVPESIVPLLGPTVTTTTTTTEPTTTTTTTTTTTVDELETEIVAEVTLPREEEDEEGGGGPLGSTAAMDFATESVSEVTASTSEVEDKPEIEVASETSAMAATTVKTVLPVDESTEEADDATENPDLIVVGNTELGFSEAVTALTPDGELVGEEEGQVSEPSVTSVVPDESVEAEAMESTTALPELVDVDTTTATKPVAATTDSEAASGCRFDDIPTQPDFHPEKFLGIWYTSASFSSQPIPIESRVAVLSSDGDGVISLIFTGSSQGVCLTTFRGYMKPTLSDPARMDASYGHQKGPFKIVYMSADYEYALTYQCSNVNPVNGNCGIVTIDVISRTTDLSQIALTDVMRRVGDVYARPSEFRFVKHEVSCPLDEHVDCRVDNFRAQSNLDWTRFSGTWYTVAMLHGRQKLEAVSWRFKKMAPGGDVTATYRASVDGSCLKPVHLVLSPAISDSGNVRVAFGKNTAPHTGKIVYTDYHEVAIWYECEEEDIIGACPYNKMHLEILQRTASASGNLYLMHHELVRSLCIDPKHLELVTHDVDCSESQKCDLSQFVPFSGFDLSKFVGTWTVLGLSQGTSLQNLRQLTFKSVGTAGLVAACMLSVENGQCEATGCSILRASHTQRPGDFELSMAGKRPGIWRVMHLDSLYALVYICERPLSADDICSPDSQLIAVLARPDSLAMTSDEIQEYVTSTVSGLCLSEVKVIPVDTSVTCATYLPPYSQSISSLPAVIDVDLERLLGMWYRTETMLPSLAPVIRLRLAREPNDGRLDITTSSSLNGTCLLPRRFLANITDNTKADWMLLGPDRRLMHVRLLYTDYTDVAIVYVCRQLLFRGICSADGKGRIDIYTRGPMITDERRRSMEDQLRYRGYAGVAGFVGVAGFDPSQLTTVAHRVACSMQFEEALCPVDNLPLLRRFQIKRFIGVWYLIARLKNSPTPETAMLRVSLAEDETVTAVYYGTRDGDCQKSIRLRWIPTANGNEAEFDVHQLGADAGVGTSKLRIVYTDYKSAMIYQCLQLLSDGSCVPGQVAVELLSRRIKMPEVRLKTQLLRRVTDLCVEQANMQDTEYENDCSMAEETTCYVDEFAKVETLPSFNVLSGRWYPLYSAKRSSDNTLTMFDVADSQDSSGLVTMHFVSNNSECWNQLTRLHPIQDRSFQFAVGFPENNVYVRVLEYTTELAALYTCAYVQGDGKCQAGQGNYHIVSRNRQHEIPAGALALYAYQATGMCIDDFNADFVKTPTTACQVAEGLVSEQCDVQKLDIQQHYIADSLLGEWRRVGVLSGESANSDAWYHARFQIRDRSSFLIQYSTYTNGSCSETRRATLTPSPVGKGEYVLSYGRQQQEDLSLLYTDGEIIVLSRCGERDSRSRCLSDQLLVEVLARNTTSLYDIERTLRAAGFGRCFTDGQIQPLVNSYAANIKNNECPLEVEPECRRNVPMNRGAQELDLELVRGSWQNIGAMNKTNSYATDQLHFDLSEDSKNLYVDSVFYRDGNCVSSLTKSFVRVSEDNYEWKTSHLSFEETLLILYVDERYLITIDCIDGACTSEDAVIQLYARARFPPTTEFDVKKLSLVLRRTCNEFTDFLLSTVSSRALCNLTPSGVLSQCSGFETYPVQTGVSIHSLTGTWYSVARFPGTTTEDVEVLRIVGDGQPMVYYSIIYASSRQGKCWSPARARLDTVTENDYSDVLFTFTKSTVRLSVVYTDYQFLVARHCVGYTPAQYEAVEVEADGNATVEVPACSPDKSTLVVYSRQRHASRTVISDLVSISRLPSSCSGLLQTQAPEEDTCPMWSPSCNVEAVGTASNFTTEELLGLWHSVYHYKSSSTGWDSATTRFQQDEETGNIAVFTAGTRSGSCQPYLNYTFAESSDGRAEWRSLLVENQVLKVMWADGVHALVYLCTNVHDNGICDPESLSINVLSRDVVVSELSPAAMDQMSIALRTACLEPGDLHTSDYKTMCPVPSLRKTGCKIDSMPVAQDVDFNKLAGVWYSYYLLHSSRQIDFSIVILQQQMNTDSFIAMFRSSRKDECLPAETATLEPRASASYLSANFDSRFKSFTGRLQVLYTDYNYALVYECAEVNPVNGKCQPQHSHAAVYGRRKQIGGLPDDVYQKLVAVANNACLYLEDFAPASPPTNVDCDLPYSGRRSCRVDDVLTLETFDVREMYGGWRLLSRSTNMADGNQSESLRFSLGVGGVMRYSRSIEDSLGNCRSTDGVVDTIGNITAATFTYTIAETTYLLKVLYMNAQYLIVNLCRARLHGGDSESGIDCSNEPDVKIYGRTTLMSVPVQRMLRGIAKPRTCVNLNSLQFVKLNDKCDLPDGCKIQDYIIHENFDHNALAGTWQVLVRSTFRQSSTLPSTIKFTPEPEGTVRIARVRNAGGTDACLTDIARMYPDSEIPGFFNTLFSQSSAVTLILYVTDEHIVTLDCIGGARGEGECTAERAELTVWGRAWSLAPPTRSLLIQETKDRTLRCYATSTMIDIQPNEHCELPPSECAVSQFTVQENFDVRLMLGVWNLRARTTVPDSNRETEVLRVALSGSTLYVTRAGSYTQFEGCYSEPEIAQPVTDQNATFIFNGRYYTQVVLLTESTLVLLHCDGIQSSQFCPPGGTTVNVYLRDGATLDDAAKRRLLLDVRERTRSCIATTNLQDVPVNDACEVVAPSEGGEACSYDDIKLASTGLTLHHIAGTWFQIARPTRIPEMQADSVTIHMDVDDAGVNFTVAVYLRDAGRCIVVEHPAHKDPKNQFQLFSVIPVGINGYNTTYKVFYADGDHLMFYECFGSEFTADGNCEAHRSHIGIFSRRRSVNTDEQRRLIGVAAQKTCFARNEFVFTDHSVKCELPGYLELSHFANKSCTVNSYPVDDDFDIQKFAGVWYEIERTRYSHATLWESSVVTFSVESGDVLQASYTGTRSGRCVGPMVAHSTRVTPDGPPADMTMWIGEVYQRGGPWSVPFRYKVIETDYHTAIIYTCHAERDDGSCRRESEQVDVLSRQPNITEETRQAIYQTIEERLCIDVHDFVKPSQQVNCLEIAKSFDELQVEPAAEKLIEQPVDESSREQREQVDSVITMMPQTPSDIEDFVESDVHDLSCALVLCQDACPLGYRFNAHGCKTCECRSADEATTQPPSELSLDSELVDFVEEIVSNPEEPAGSLDVPEL